MKILLKCFASDQNLPWCQYALVELDEATRRKILARRELYQQVKSSDVDVWTLSFWGIPGEFYDSMDIESIFPDEMLTSFEMDEYLVLPEGMADAVSLYVPFFEKLEAARTELDRTVITDDGVQWMCVVKHTDVRIETARLPYTVIEP